MRDVDMNKAINDLSTFAGKVAGQLGGNAKDTEQVTRTDLANFLLHLALVRGPLTEEIVARIVRITGDDIDDLQEAEEQVSLYHIDSDEFVKTAPASFRQMISADAFLGWFEEEYSVSQTMMNVYNAVGNALFIKNQEANGDKLSAMIALMEYLQMMTQFRESKADKAAGSDAQTGGKSSKKGVPAPEKR